LQVTEALRYALCGTADRGAVMPGNSICRRGLDAVVADAGVGLGADVPVIVVGVGVGAAIAGGGGGRGGFGVTSFLSGSLLAH